jgi:toxin ParE1/3/4
VKPHFFHPDAGEEYTRAVEYYNAISPHLGTRFHDEIERLIRDICTQPGRFFCFSPPAQRALARRFPYSVVFLDQTDRIWIVAVMHAKRRPGYWRERAE